MTLFGYGEDALSFCALTERLPAFLEALNDDSRPEDAVVLFRPSFGRSGGKSSPFGEFDGIVGTSRGVYLVEAKWSRSGEAWRPTMSLRPEQLNRHRIFRWYLERWRSTRSANWAAFATTLTDSDFSAQFTGKRLPPSVSILAQSLEFTLQMLSDSGPLIEDVLLYCDIDGRPCPPHATDLEFRPVHMHFAGADRSGFFTMASHVESRPPTR